MIRKILMAATVVVLVLLNIIAPRLMGTETEVSSHPKLMVDYFNNNTTVYIKSAFGDFRYSNISIYVEDVGLGWKNFTRDDDIHTLFLRIPASVTTDFYLNATASDGKTLYEYNCTIVIDTIEEKIEISEEKTYKVNPPFIILMKVVSD